MYYYDLYFDHPLNNTVTDAIYTEMFGLSGGKLEYTEEVCRAGCGLYFTSKKKDYQKEINGTKKKHRAQCRSTARKSKKLEERKQAFRHSDFELSSEEKQFGQDILSLGMAGVSSDEDSISDDEGPIDRRKRKRSACKVRRVKEFYWQSARFVDMKDKMDNFFINNIAKAAHLRLRETRVRDASGPVSDRKPPAKAKGWMLKSLDIDENQTES